MAGDEAGGDFVGCSAHEASLQDAMNLVAMPRGFTPGWHESSRWDGGKGHDLEICGCNGWRVGVGKLGLCCRLEGRLSRIRSYAGVSRDLKAA
ncbi:MAG: hypothetical protein RLZZ505_732 [Verrucomicrobiota bacterium]|jgi:hypothetical protein